MKITYIIPLNVFDSTVEKYLTKAINSLNSMTNKKTDKIFLVGPSEVINKANVVLDTCGCKQTVTLISNSDTDFATQINVAVMKCTTEFFSILEFDDEYYPYWVSKVDEYYKSNDFQSVYMPINELMNEKGEVISFANEIALSNSFSNEIGIIDMDSLNSFMDFNVTGAIIKTEKFISLGGLKKSMKIAAWYEFLLRAVYNNEGVEVLPFAGYKHTIGRPDSYMEDCAKTMSDGEGEWLINTAKEEYFFKEDRNKVFEGK